MRNCLPDLFPYTLRRRSTDLGAYQRQAQRQPGWWLLVLSLLFYGAVLFSRSSQSQSSDVTWSAMTTAEVELAAAGYAESWPSWLRWFTGVENEEEALGWMAEEFERLAEEGKFNEEGMKARDRISALARGEVTWESEAYWQEKFQGSVWTWERMAAMRQYRGRSPAWLERDADYYRSYSRKKAYQLAVGECVWLVTFVLCLPFLPSALRCFQTKRHESVSPILRAWRPSMVTVRYIFSTLLTSTLYSYLYMMIPYALWTDFPGPTFVLTDSVWRLGDPVFLGIFLFVKWRHVGRILGLHLKPLLKPVLGMVSLGILYNRGLLMVMEQFSLQESLEGLSYWEDGGWGLMFVILSGVVLAPFVEEVVFRGVLFQSYLRRFGFWGATLLSTFFFVVIHFYDFQGSLSIAFFGVGACVLYRATGSLWSAILFHAITNGLIFGTMWPTYYDLNSL